MLRARESCPCRYVTGDPLTRLDPRTPLVLDLAELGRRPGSMLRNSRLVPAPGHLDGELVRVPDGFDLELDLRLESVVEGVLVTGSVRGTAVGECARCLDVIEVNLETDIQELFAYPGHEDETTSVVEDDLINLEPTVHDAVVLALPLAPLCREDCPGLCSICGARLADEPGHKHEEHDPRWAALAQLGGTETAPGGETSRLLRPDDEHRQRAGEPEEI